MNYLWVCLGSVELAGISAGTAYGFNPVTLLLGTGVLIALVVLMFTSSSAAS